MMEVEHTPEVFQTTDLEERFDRFFRAYYLREILRVVRGYPEEKSLIVNFEDLDNYDITLADEVLNNPDVAIPAAQRALAKIELPVDYPSIRLNLRFTNLPSTSKLLIRDIRSADVGKLIAVDGIVRKATDVRPKLVVGAFECQRCGSIMHIPQNDDSLKEPYLCESCEKRGPFKLDVDNSQFVDSQKILIQENLEDLRGGEHPKQITVLLEDDLTGKITPGDSIEVIGILRAARKKTGNAKSRVFDIFIEANNFNPVQIEFEEVRISKEEEKKIIELSQNPEIYDMIRKSIAPHIFGYDEIKEAIMYQLFSAPPVELPDGGRIRGDSHIIIMGEPATGKSEILQYVAKELAPRGVYASGKGTSGAGLTAAAVKDEFGDGGWSLEAGALVLADRGIACLSPDSKVILNNRIMKIEDAFDESRSFRAISGVEGVEISPVEYSTVSIDNLRSVESRSTLVRRKKYRGKLIELRLASGFKIKLTPEHLLIDGSTLEWKRADRFSPGEHVVAPLKLPENTEDIYILDIIPEDWIAILDREEKEELKSTVLRAYPTLAEFNRKHRISRDFLSGGSQIKVGIFRRVLKELGVYEEWRNKKLAFGRKSSGEKLKVSKITPELAYFVGFVYGDGSFSITDRRSSVAICQAEVNSKQIEAVKKAFENFSSRELGVYRRESRSMIRSKEVRSKNQIIYSNSNLLAFLCEYFTGNSLRNILRLSDDCLKAFIAGCLDSDGCISIKKSGGYEVVHAEFQLTSDEESALAFILALRRFDCYARLVKGKGVLKIVITGRRDVEALINAVKGYSVKAKEVPQRRHAVSACSDKLPAAVVSKICRKVARGVKKSILVERGVWSTVHAYINRKYLPSREQLEKIVERLSDVLSSEIKLEITGLTARDFFLDRIVEIKEVEYSGYVYDLYVPEYHNFVCNGIIVHNCIDEFDKMESSDRSAMHEAMEQQSVSIAKAGILATFRSRCAILAAANPKYGRFDEYRPISEQVNLPPTILSRFDLIFFVRDDLSKTRDIARHILDTASSPESIKPPLPPELLKKYIAYARQNIFPELSEEARRAIEDFYVEMREAAQHSEDVPIPLTARQLWAIVRLAKASARVRLSNVVTAEDAHRAISLVKTSLAQAGLDLETGRVDIDKIYVGVTKSQRDKIKEILSIIKELEDEYGTAKRSEILSMAEERGIPKSTAQDLIEKLRQQGDIFEPKYDHFKTT